MDIPDRAVTQVARTISLVVPAAGCGARAALSSNKILAPIQGRPLLWWTLRGLTADPLLRVTDGAVLSLLELVVVSRDEERSIVTEIWNDVGSVLPMKVVTGGRSRQLSVAAALPFCHGDLVAVHDAARPLVTAALLERVGRAAAAHGGGIAALAASDTVKRVRSSEGGSFVSGTLPRSSVYLAQTPQVFRRGLLLAALDAANSAGFEGTDCASVVEAYLANFHCHGQSVAVVEGDSRNIKVTFAADLERVEAMLRN